MTSNEIVADLIPRDPVAVQHVIARGMAVQHYAALEQALAALFAELSGMPPSKAGIVFFRIQNARSRNAVLEKLLAKTTGDQYRAFWSSLVRFIQNLDETRNKIVHWGSEFAQDFHPDKPTRQISLVPPNYSDLTVASERIGQDGLNEFIAKCHFANALTMMFWMTLARKGPLVDNPTWQEIFQQQVTYPPPNTHPAFRKTS